MPLGNPSGPFFGVSGWKKELEARAARVDQTLNIIVENDFVVSNDAATSTALGGTATYDTGLTGGVLRLATNVLGSAQAVVFNAGQGALVSDPSAESWYAQARCWIKGPTPLGATGFGCIGMQDTGLTGEFIALGLNATYSDTYLVLIISDGGTTTPHVTNVAADLNGFHDYGIGRDVVNDKIYAMVDDTPILELDGPFAELTSLPSLVYSSVEARPILGQDVELWVDNIATVVKRYG